MAGFTSWTPRQRILVFVNLVAVVIFVVFIAQGQKRFLFLPGIRVMESRNTTGRFEASTNDSSASSKLAYDTLRPTLPSTRVCHFTNVDAFDPLIIKKFQKFPPLNCDKGRPWLVYKEGQFLKVNISKVKEHPKAVNFSHCRCRTLTKRSTNDNSVIYGNWSKRFNDTMGVTSKDVFMEAECYDKSNVPISNSYFTFMVLKHETHKNSHLLRYVNHLKKFAPKETFNLLLVGVDGLSKQNCERAMPKTRNFLLKNLGAIELEKYNKVGLNTFPNVLPMLTGHSAGFYKKGNWTSKQPFDRINSYFVWSEYSKAGYRTALDLEEKYITAFHYLKKGFYTSPVDYYSRALVLAMSSNKNLASAGKYCKGDKPAVHVHNDFLLELTTQFKEANSPFFGFSFLTKLTHDDQNRASSADDLYLSFLRTLKDSDALNNTVMVFFSDHGERFGSIRHTYNGIIESKSPAGFIALPQWFKSKYPEEFNRLQINAGRLVSVYDLHATFRDILYFKSSSPPAVFNPEIGISLFQKLIPESRTCVDAGIPTEYCNCNSLTKVNIDKNTEKLLSSAITTRMMEALGNFAVNKCHNLLPKSVESILEKERPLDRIKNIITDNSILYHITIATTPGHGVFEAVVEYKKKEKTARVVGTISRLDMYKGEKDCITDPKIRPFCFCK